MSREARLLIVEDEAAIAGIVAEAAAACGYETRTVANPGEVGGALAEFAPTHITLDLQMPGRDGIEVLGQLAQDECRARIVIVSGFDGKVIETARRIGAEKGLDIAATLHKPLRVAEMQNLLARLRAEAGAIDGPSLERALANGQFFLVYQPKFDLRGAGGGLPLAGFEALVRWNHPGRGPVPPGDFLPAMQFHGMMNALTDAVVDMALAQLAQWRDLGLATALALNIDALNLVRRDWVDDLTRRCAEAGIAPDRITLELTETSAMQDPAAAMEILSRLRIRGFRLSIDDFGTGYSSLAQLQVLPFSELKIDRRFVQDCDRSSQSHVLVRTMIDLAANLGLASVAEGVETAGVLDTVRDLGCNYAQGFHLARPLDAAAAEELLRQAG